MLSGEVTEGGWPAERIVAPRLQLRIVPRTAGAQGQGTSFQQAPGGGVGHQAVVFREVTVLPVGQVAEAQKGACE